MLSLPGDAVRLIGAHAPGSKTGRSSSDVFRQVKQENARIRLVSVEVLAADAAAAVAAVGGAGAVGVGAVACCCKYHRFC